MGSFSKNEGRVFSGFSSLAIRNGEHVRRLQLRI